ncbi:hypothetical protein [Streptomyces johnsoniae]|uniref:Uncharacterized protein n=1 Tax=Streptomyces johnsoniae TaxID=3075532 RepID=A0ABU2S0S8_9ACTN|nr:hypothetical protein [Streptomyces sp. DSM 41886]MDT0442291.1 hypothetical protein [Streptomyces sp. DSM 41886]
MSKRTTQAVADLLSSPENENRTAEEVAELVVELVQEELARTNRVAVVAQIQEGPRPPMVVALGPFSARGILDTPGKFLKAVSGGTAARTAGEGLAWNPSTKVGRGRFMLVPILRTPRDAWLFYGQLPEDERPDEGDLYAAAREMTAWNPEAIEPACVCGLTHVHPCPQCGQPNTHHCYRHQLGEQHNCRR